MFYARLMDVLLDWLKTGRFPREELRVRPILAVPFFAIVLTLAIAVLLHAR